MKAPTLPHIGVPDVTHRVAHDVGERAGDVGDFVSDAWSTGVDRAQDLAAAAVEIIEDIPDKALALAGAVIPALRPTPKRSTRPFVLAAAAVATFVVVAWFLKKRRASSAEPAAMPHAAPASANVSAAS